ncbi:hypothetical protein [Kribbella sancticallisti]|uniref:hypothetical protein n=1 Tax=Kribbella sancticallisti TaxID=460087 RepID=UPI0031CEDC90
MTTLRAELRNFGRAEEALALLEVFLEVGLPWLGDTVLDPRGLLLPDELTDDRAVVQGLIEDIEGEPEPPKRLLTLAERAFDVSDEQARWDFTRLSYCSIAASVWSKGRRTTYFEVVNRERATYWLPDSLKARYFDAIAAKGWAVPEDWLAAVPKRPKPWWKRGR